MTVERIEQEENANSRLEAFCDGVFSVALTLLIIDVTIPSAATINTTNDFWRALNDILPSLAAFLLSFAVVFITWVNHHATLRLVNKSSAQFIYANGLFLLTVVFIPFPTSLLGRFLLTDHASPAVILYSGVCALQAIGWFFLTRAALNVSKPLTRNDRSTLAMQESHKFSYFAFALYVVCAILAVWLPQVVAAAMGAIWLVWLIVGINMRSDEPIA